MLERLEDRTLLAGNLLVTAELPGIPVYNLQEYTQQGALVSSQNISLAPGTTDLMDARGLSVGPSGNASTYDGTNAPSLATYSTNSNSWSYLTASGWSTVNNVSYGGVAAYNNYVFATDMTTTGSGAPDGIIRFNTTDGSAVRFGQGSNFIQLALGLDGQLYGLESYGVIQVFDPNTLALERTFTLLNGPDVSNVRAIAVDSSGNVLAASWNGYIAKYDTNGNYTGLSVQARNSYGLSDNLISISLDTDGQVAVGGHHGNVFLTNDSLSSVQSFLTNQWNVFVTFDHYIGADPQIVTPTFENLAGPTITYGQSSVTLGGQISAGSAYPPGSLNITLNGVTESATIDPTNGDFSAVFNTSTLGVSNSPYTITYSYPGANNYAAVKDVSKSLTVVPATTTLINLSSPTVVVATSTTTFSGTLSSNSVLPVGQSVTVAIEGSSGALASGSGTIGSNGQFAVTLDTGALPVGAYTIQYSYAGDANFKGSSETEPLNVTYAVNTQFDTSKPVHAGAALPIKLALSDALGNDLSSASLSITAVSLVGPNGVSYTLQSKGNANSNNEFRHVGFGYLYNLDTTGLAAGTYTLYVEIAGDPVLHAISFVIA
jgi:hypothetical protein